MRGAQREITGWLLKWGYKPDGRWTTEEEDDQVDDGPSGDRGAKIQARRLKRLDLDLWLAALDTWTHGVAALPGAELGDEHGCDDEPSPNPSACGERLTGHKAAEHSGEQGLHVMTTAAAAAVSVLCAQA